MPASFGSTPTSTTTLGANQFPVSGVFVPGTSAGDLTALQGGPASTDGNGYISAPVVVYQATGTNLHVVVDSGAITASGTVTANAGSGTFAVAGTVTANIGTTNGLALDTSVNGLLVSQGSTTSGEKGPLVQGAVTTGAPTYTTAQTSPLSLTTAGALRVDGSGVTQPVSGTITANQGGSWTVTANAGTGSFTVAQATGTNLHTVVDSGTVTANIGTTNGLALDTSVNGLLVSQGSATSGEKGPLIQGAVTTNAPTYVTAQTSPLSLDTAGLLRASLKDTPSNTNNLNVNLAASAATVTVSASGNFNNASIGATAAAVPASASYIGGNKAGNLVGFSLDGSGNLNVNVAAGGGSGGTSSSFSAAFPATGTAAGASDGTNMKPLLVDASGFLKVNVSAGGGSGGTSSSFGAAFPATGTAAGYSDGTNMQGPRAFDADTGAGTQYVAGANIRISGSGGSIEAKGQQTMANSLPVAIASDQSAVPVSGTVTANIGTTNGLALDASVTGLQVAQASTTSGQKGSLIQGAVTTSAPTYTTAQTNPLSLDTSGLLRVSLKDTPANTNNLNVALAASSATVTVSGTVTANAGTNLNTSLLALESGGNLATLAGGVSGSKYQTNVAQIGGSNVSTSATGVQKVGVVGNAGATLDSTAAAGTAPTNALLTGAVYNTSAPAPTNGQAMALQADQAGNVRAFPGIALAALSAWNNATALNATQTIFTNSGAPAVLVQLTQTTTITGGAITFEVSFDGSTWVTTTASQVTDPTSSTYAQIALPYTLQASTNKYFIISNNGWQGFRIKLSTQITGTGTVTPNYALLSYDPVDSAIVYSPTAANFLVTASQGGAPWSENITQFGGSNVATGTGAGGSGIPRVTISNDSTVGSNAATGSAVPANAFSIGGDAATALPTAGSGGNLTSVMVDKYGRVIVMGGLRELKGTQHTTITSSLSETTIVTAGGASVFCDLYCLIINNSSGTACNVTIKDSTAGTTRFIFSVPAGDVRGFSLPQDSAHPQSGANANWTATCSASVASIDITALFVNNK